MILKIWKNDENDVSWSWMLKVVKIWTFENDDWQGWLKNVTHRIRGLEIAPPLYIININIKIKIPI